MDLDITKNQSNFIKLVAILSMLIDHIGAFLFPSILLLRIIGRISFPLFAYQLKIGYLKTSNKKRYIKSLIFFGIISQIPFYFLTNELRLNILFSLALGVVSFWVIEKKKYYYLIVIIFLSFFVDYGLYGLVAILIFYIFKNKIIQFLLFSLSTLIYSICILQPLQVFAIFSFALIVKPIFKINLPKNFFYIFYPAHLAIILFFKLVFF